MCKNISRSGWSSELKKKLVSPGCLSPRLISASAIWRLIQRWHNCFCISARESEKRPLTPRARHSCSIAPFIDWLCRIKTHLRHYIRWKAANKYRERRSTWPIRARARTHLGGVWNSSQIGCVPLAHNAARCGAQGIINRECWVTPRSAMQVKEKEGIIIWRVLTAQPAPNTSAALITVIACPSRENTEVRINLSRKTLLVTLDSSP